MLNTAPPLFNDFPQVGIDPAQGQDRSVIATFGTDDQWWELATLIGNEILDARTLAEIEEIKAHRAVDIRDLLAARRDLAAILSIMFGDQRQALGKATR